MSELLDYVSFQRRVCENQLKSYNKILNESHPKYKLLKEEYEFYLLMEDIVQSLENQAVTADQIDDATQVLQNILNQFKSSLSNLNEAGMFDAIKSAGKSIGKFARGITTGHNINDLAKEQSVKNFTQVYQSFKPLLQASNIIDGMLDKVEQQGASFSSESLKNLKLGGSMGAELKNLILKAASSDQGVQKLKSSLQIVQNYGQNSTNPVLSNFISDDLINNSIDVGIKASFGAAPLRGQGSNKQTGWMKDVEGELGGDKSPVVGSEPSDQSQQDRAAFGGSSMFSGIQHAPEHDVDLSDLNKQNKPGEPTRQKFRQIAKTAGVDDKTTAWMVKSGLAKWASENPDQFMKLAQQLMSGGGTIAENKNIVINFINNHQKEKQLVTEVVNKWNKLAGLKG